MTGELVRDAIGRGIDLIFLSEADEEVAPIHRPLGCVWIATAMSAEPPAI